MSSLTALRLLCFVFVEVCWIFCLDVGMLSCFPSGGKLVGREEGRSTDAGRKAAKGVDENC